MNDLSETHGYKIVQLGIFILLAGGTLYVTDLFKSYYLIAILGGLLLLWFECGMTFKLEWRGDISEISYILFCTFILISGFLHFEASMLISGIGLIAIWFVCVSMLHMFYTDISSTLVSCVIITHVVVFLVSSLTSPITLGKWEGLYSNPNGMGGGAATLACVLIPTLISKLNSERSNLAEMLLLTIGIIASLFVAVCSSSRTSVINILIMLLLALIIIIKKDKDKTVLNRVLIIILFVIFVLFLLINL